MAEYKVFHCPYGDDFEGGDECDRCEQYELCMETPTADAIERSEYDKLLQENKNLKARIESQRNNLKMARDSYDVVKKECDELHFKIDKAIDEMQKEIEENHLNVIEYADGEWIVKDFVYGAIERLRSNLEIEGE